MAKASASPPWPREVLDKYAPIRTLGKGAFATVVLARRKLTTKGDENRLVAMKQVKACTHTEVQYSHRELYILQELSHPNIMKLVESWEPSEGSVLMALSYAPGKTLEYLLRNIGAPSLAFCRVVIAQLVDAVAYLHSVCSNPSSGYNCNLLACIALTRSFPLSSTQLFIAISNRTT